MKVKKKRFKDQVAELAEADPDFYEYLKAEEADIFNSSDEEPMEDETIEEDTDEKSEFVMEQGDEGSANEEGKDTQGEILQSGNELSVQLQTDASGTKLIDSNLLKFLQAVLSNPSEHRAALGKTVQVAVHCFASYVARVSEKKSSRMETPKYTVHKEKTFDELVRICFKYLGRCMLILLNPAQSKEIKNKKRESVEKIRRGPTRRNLTKFKNWHKYSSLTKEYLISVHIFLMELQSSEAMVSAIRATVDLVDLYLHYPKLCKLLVKTLIQSWSRKAEDVQVISFAALSKIVRFDAELFVVVYKGCYKSYIANCKQVNAETLPLISFMQKSFTELTLLNDKLACQYAFLYIRQFAIHLRNAMIAKRKDLIQTVYNWQFVQGLYLWVNVVCQGSKSQTASGYQWFKEVGYPLVEIISILRKVFISNKYLPLRIHCVKMLLQIQASCDVYIPTLFISAELLNELSTLDEKKPESGKGSTSVVNIQEILRLSKTQIKDVGYRNKIAEELYNVCLEAMTVLKGSIAFNELSVPIEAVLKKFVKKCRSRHHVVLFKSFYRKLLKEASRSELTIE